MSSTESEISNRPQVEKDLPKDEYESVLPALRVDLVNMQYDLRHSDFSVLLVLTGDDRKGVNEVLDALHEWMDARHLKTHIFLFPQKEELEYPPHWRYWRALPPTGKVGVFAGAWPVRALAERILGGASDEVLDQQIGHMNGLERTLAVNGMLLLKVWLHAEKKEVKKRLKKARKDPDSEPYISQEDALIYELFDEVQPVAERILTDTETAWAPWDRVDSTHPRHRNLRVARRLLEAVSARLAAGKGKHSGSSGRATQVSSSPVSAQRVPDILATIDLEARLDREEYRDRLSDLQGKLARLIRKAEEGVGTVLAFEGQDAAGKGGVIRRITNAMFAHHYRVIPVAAPTDEELRHHYLWRFWNEIPRDGQMVIFDRTWYGRVLVERVEGLASETEWRRGYDEINAFEEQLVDHGLVLCKFWLQIDPDEQLRRFQAREQTGYKKYKITDEDYRNRDQWPAYAEATNEMLAHTSTEGAPWHLIAANDKKWARIQVLEQVVSALRKGVEDR